MLLSGICWPPNQERSYTQSGSRLLSAIGRVYFIVTNRCAGATKQEMRRDRTPQNSDRLHVGCLPELKQFTPKKIWKILKALEVKGLPLLVFTESTELIQSSCALSYREAMKWQPRAIIQGHSR